MHASYIHPPRANGGAVVLLHSVSDNLLHIYGFGKWLVENHCSVLMTDARGLGNSGGIATYRIREADDIPRWVDWIEMHEPARCVYGMRESIGGAQLLEAFRSLASQPTVLCACCRVAVRQFPRSWVRADATTVSHRTLDRTNILPSDGRH